MWAAGLAVVAVATDDALFSWLNARGGLTAGVHVASRGGLRGLETTRDCTVGDVLLEVPLTACLLDDVCDLPGSAPDWCAPLPWNVQLAANVLARRGESEWAPFLASWPSSSPALPKDCEPDELALGGDATLEVKADESCFWLEEMYWAARQAHAASAAGPTALAPGAGFGSADEFRCAVAQVWSRCLRLSTGSHGVRRVLVPLLDLANHEPIPSALYAYAPAPGGGPACVRLHAARDLSAGEPVTITYGEHPSSHFALYYGFVPRTNPFDTLPVTLAQALGALAAAAGSDAADGGEAALVAADRAAVERAAIEAAREAEAGSGEGAASFALRAAAPPRELLSAITRSLLAAGHCAGEEEGGGSARRAEEVALRAVAATCAHFERALRCGFDSDEEMLEALGALTERAELLLSLRLARRRLATELRGRMHELAERYRADPEAASTALAALLASAEEVAVYPGLDPLPVEELESWASLAWDERRFEFVSADSLPASATHTPES